jgi:hypothetical protein
MGMGLLIEENLPADFLRDLGVYLQTCAHIELQVGVLIAKIEYQHCSDLADPKFRFPAIRKLPVGPLNKRLKTAAERLPSPLKERVANLATYIDDFKSNRHLMVHGACFVDSATTNVKVNFFHEVGGRLVEDTNLIDGKTSRSVLEAADQCLREAIALVDLIAATKDTDGCSDR